MVRGRRRQTKGGLRATLHRRGAWPALIDGGDAGGRSARTLAAVESGTYHGVVQGAILTLGLLTGALGRFDEAARHLTACVGLCERIQAPLWLAQAQRVRERLHGGPP